MTRRYGVRLRIRALLLGIIVIAGVLTTSWFFLCHKSSDAHGSETQGVGARLTSQAAVTSPVPSPGSQPVKEVVLMPISQTATTLNSPETDVEQDLSTLEMILREYRRQYQHNPTGDNVEITTALTGINDRSLDFIPKSAKNLVNVRGELIDRWGTPFFSTSNRAPKWKSAPRDQMETFTRRTMPFHLRMRAGDPGFRNGWSDIFRLQRQ